MKTKSFITVLLFILLFAFVSCDETREYYEDGNYSRFIEKLSEKKKLTENDLLLKTKALIALDRKDEADKVALQYLFSSADDADRDFAVELFIEHGYSDVLNVLLLKVTDGFKAQTVLFKSLYNLGMYKEAENLLINRMADSLTIEQFLKILLKYPVNDEYTLSFFKSWFHILTDEEVMTFAELFSVFLRSDMSDECRLGCAELTDEIKHSEYSYILKGTGNVN